jgi:hypothetical protein
MASSIKQWYTVINTEKYVGKKQPYCRSTWELVFCRKCDTNPSIIQWAHEPLQIPYKNPLHGGDKYTVYVPDFLMVYIDKSGNKHAELIEIKPAKEAIIERAKSNRDKISLAVNAAKWEAAGRFCAKVGMRFRVITEDDIFNRPIK